MWGCYTGVLDIFGCVIIQKIALSVLNISNSLYVVTLPPTDVSWLVWASFPYLKKWEEYLPLQAVEKVCEKLCISKDVSTSLPIKSLS